MPDYTIDDSSLRAHLSEHDDGMTVTLNVDVEAESGNVLSVAAVPIHVKPEQRQTVRGYFENHGRRD